MTRVPAGYAAALGRSPDDPDLVLDRRGMRNDVLVDRLAGVVYRFPRYADDLVLLPLTAARLDAVRALGVPAPRVIGGVLAGELGRAHLVLTHVPGIALDDDAVPDLPPAVLDRLGADLGRILVRLRHLPADGWPEPVPDWVELWTSMADRCRARVLPLLGRAAAAQAVDDLAAAVDAARVAPAGLVHGDLGGVNVRLDPATGDVTGVIDWDAATPGDAAGDVAAVRALAVPGRRPDPPPAMLAQFPPGDDEGAGYEQVIRSMVRAEPSLREDLARFAAYLATWPLQGALYGVEHADRRLVEDGLTRYSTWNSSTWRADSASRASAASSASPLSASRTTEAASPGG